VVDCTGHGVPGAFMSLVGHAMLQQIVAEQDITEPAAILSAMHQRVRDALRQDTPGSNNQDGMDVCLVRIDADQIVFAGAHRPLWWALADGTFGEIKGNRISLGGGHHEKRRAVFDQHTLPRSAGLTLYLASDGYADQPNHLRQPFDTSRLRTLLKRIAAEPMSSQTASLNEALDTHSGGAAQRDDITLLAIRLN
jgi:serine phosphatase RsbU (regulator of sigma subunit)